MVLEKADDYLRNGASGETRTLTSVKKPDFESGASTSSATEAFYFKRLIRVLIFLIFYPLINSFQFENNAN